MSRRHRPRTAGQSVRQRTDQSLQRCESVPEQVIPVERITKSILVIRGQKVLLDSDLAELYGVETRVLNQSVRRNRARFPSDFMFQLTADETSSLRSQFVILETGRGRHRKFEPHAFTEQGVAMLSSVLRWKGSMTGSSPTYSRPFANWWLRRRAATRRSASEGEPHLPSRRC